MNLILYSILMVIAAVLLVLIAKENLDYKKELSSRIKKELDPSED